MIFSLFKEILSGKNIGRFLENRELEKITINGNGIDLGAKSGSSSYFRYLNKSDDTQVIFSDLNSTSEKILKIDLENDFPVENNSQDFLLLMNVMEHLYNYRKCVSESYRILKPGGRLIGSVPFLHRVHPDPDDYFRYTESALKKIFDEAGFSNIKVIACSIGPFTAGASIYSNVLKSRLIKLTFTLTALLFDKTLLLLLPKYKRRFSTFFPVRYVFVAKK